MANPQIDNGHPFIQISTEIWEALMRSRISGVENQIIRAIIRKTWGFKKTEEQISVRQFMEMTGIARVAVYRAISNLLKKDMICIKNDTKKHPTYRIQKNYDRWVVVKRNNIDTKICNNIDTTCNNIDTTHLIKDKHTFKTKKPSRRKQKTFAQDSIEIELSRHLLSQIRKNSPEFKEPNLQMWAGHIDALIRIDKKTPINIGAVIDWAQRDNFWNSVILSTSKLRKQYESLWLKMSKKGATPAAPIVPISVAPPDFKG